MHSRGHFYQKNHHGLESPVMQIDNFVPLSLCQCPEGQNSLPKAGIGFRLSCIKSTHTILVKLTKPHISGLCICIGQCLWCYMLVSFTCLYLHSSCIFRFCIVFIFMTNRT